MTYLKDHILWYLLICSEVSRGDPALYPVNDGILRQGCLNDSTLNVELSLQESWVYPEASTTLPAPANLCLAGITDGPLEADTIGEGN